MEDAKDYKAFEAAITADYDVEMAVARELVLRLASLWRLRRAAAIEAYLFEIQTESLAPHQVEIGSPTQKREASVDHAFESPLGDENREWQQSNDHLAEQYKKCVRGLTHSFLCLAKMDSRAFERLNRYEVALWRQTRQTLFVLHPRRYRSPPANPEPATVYDDSTVLTRLSIRNFAPAYAACPRRDNPRPRARG